MAPVFSEVKNAQPASKAPASQTNTQQKKESSQDSPVNKPITKRVIRKTGSGYTPSIKDAISGKLQDKQEESPKEKMKLYTSEQLHEPFTKEQFEAKWKEYLTKLDERPGLKSTLSNIPEIFNETKLKLKISNFIQNEDITSIKPDLVAWLRKELRNTNIELITEIEASEQAGKKALTDTDKLNEMVKKNPNLALLKQKFNLDYGE